MNTSSEEIMSGVLDQMIEDAKAEDAAECLVQLTFRSMMLSPQGTSNQISGDLANGPVPFSYKLKVHGHDDKRRPMVMEMHFPASEVARVTRAMEPSAIVEPPPNLRVS